MSSRSPATRSRILNSAWEILEAAQGREVRMTDIATRAGVSRQALYLHFPTRAELLVATTHHIDQVKDVDGRLVRSRAARTGVERLDAFIDAWGTYIPEIYGVAKALMIMGETDEAAKAAWADRMRAIREGCRAAVDALHRDGQLAPAHSPEHATDILTALLSVRTWEHLTVDCGWPQALYLEKSKILAKQMLVCDSSAS